MSDSTGVSFWRRCAGSSQQDRRNQLMLAFTCVGWALILVACKYLLVNEQLSDGWSRWLVALLPMLAGLGLVAMFLRFLRGADEFQRLAQLQAIGVGFGFSFFLFAGYPLLELAGAPGMSLDDLAAVMPISYVAGMLVSWWQYR